MSDYNVINASRHDYYCNNCGRQGHSFYNCMNPITSFGVVVFRHNPTKGREYLMICRKDTLGFIDFIRGKYLVNNRQYIMNMLNQMTIDEKQDLRTKDFLSLWKRIWGENAISSQYRIEESLSCDKFNTLLSGVTYNSEVYTLNTLIDESDKINVWNEPEWGFPKGRRNYQEREYDCAVREMSEETGYSVSQIINLNNVLPFDEIFTGSNYKSYKHKYFIAYMDYEVSLSNCSFEKNEVSKMIWNTFDECKKRIRIYNKEKIRVLDKIDNTLSNYRIFSDESYGYVLYNNMNKNRQTNVVL